MAGDGCSTWTNLRSTIAAQENITEDNTSPVPPSVQVPKFASDSQINIAMLHAVCSLNQMQWPCRRKKSD